MADCLETLDLSFNYLVSINIGHLTNLRAINLDSNCITKIFGLEQIRSLETLSWREQGIPTMSEHNRIQFDDCIEMRNLFLSGNKIPGMLPMAVSLNLRCLELASTGLQSLSTDFGVKMPNLRVLNLNQNGLKDIRPLLGIVQLEELLLAGNRISRLRRAVAVLVKLGGKLKSLDLRENPITVGFYDSHAKLDLTEQNLIVKKRSKRDNQKGTTPTFMGATNYCLPPADCGSDKQHRQRLDDETALRRRVFEMLVLSGCRRLEYLDGLDVVKVGASGRDGVWDRLVTLGILSEKRS